MDRYINCRFQCPIPEGLRLTEIPQKSHHFSDVLSCPNEGCFKTFFIIRAYQETDQEKE